MFDLSHYHTFGLRAQAKQFINIGLDTPPLISEDQHHYILGQGSNTVFVDDFDGTVYLIANRGVKITEQRDSFYIDAAAGENWHQLVKQLIDAGIGGLENLALIPGTVGAAPIQNIGAYGRELADFCASVTVVNRFTGKTEQFRASECRFGYRDSIFKRPDGAPYIISRVQLSLPRHWQAKLNYGELKQTEVNATAKDIYHRVIQIRRAKLPDPNQLGNAGSFFKNPIVDRQHAELVKQTYPELPVYPINGQQCKIPAAYLIDQLGFKGYEKDGIGCHSGQPLVLYNTGNGSGPALMSMARTIRDRVLAEFDITLVNEVRLIGKHGLIEL